MRFSVSFPYQAGADAPLVHNIETTADRLVMLQNHQLRAEPAKMAAALLKQTGYVAIGPTPAATTQAMLDNEATRQALQARGYASMRGALRVPAPQVTCTGCARTVK